MTIDSDWWLKQAKEEVQRNSASSAAWNNLSMAHSSVGHYDEALQCIKKALSLNSRNSPGYSFDSEIWSWRDLATIHEDLGLVDEAKADIEAVRELCKEKEPTMVGTSKDWQDLARDYRFIGDKDEVIRCLERATAIDSSFSYGWRDLGALYRGKGDLVKAKQYYETAIEVNWTSDDLQKAQFAVELWNSLGQIYDALDNAGMAEQYYQQEKAMKAEFERAWLEIMNAPDD